MFIFIFSLFINVIFNQVLTDNSFNTSRAVSLAGATVSNPGKLESVFYNPAYLPNLNKTGFVTGKTNYYEQDFLNYSYFSFIYCGDKFLPKSNLALTFQSLSTTPDSDVQNYLSRENALTLSQGYLLLKDKNSSLSIGYNINYFILEQGRSAGTIGDGSNGLGDQRITSFGLDIGIYGTLRGKIMMGAFIKNFNSPAVGNGAKSHYLPRRLNIGFSYMPMQKLKTSFEFQRSIGTSNNQFRVAMIYDLFENFTLRAGTQLKPNRFGVGFSMNFNNFVKFSYGLITHPVLPITHNFELGIFPGFFHKK